MKEKAWTKRFISISLVLAYIVFVGYILYMKISEVPPVFIAFTSIVNLVVGAYFGNSIAKENQAIKEDKIAKENQDNI